MELEIELNGEIPLYRQIAQKIKQRIECEELNSTTTVWLPSINKLSNNLGVSKDTIKKAYYILRQENYVDATQGKGFFIKLSSNKGKKILILFDVLNSYKRVIFESFSMELPGDTEYTIRLFNQEIDLFEKFIKENLGAFDFYVVTPHLPLDKDIQQRAIKILQEIPTNRLVLLDRKLDLLKGNYISVYQGFESDIIQGLEDAEFLIKKYKKLNVFVMKRSLYGGVMEKTITSFCQKKAINVEFFFKDSPSKLEIGCCYFLLSGQLDTEIITFFRLAKRQNLNFGSEIGLFAINESPINEIILNGLSVLSTDFRQMGKTAGELLMSGKKEKIKCKFYFIERKTL